MEDIIRALLDVVRAQHAAAQETEEAPFDMNDIVDMAMNIVGRPDESEEEEEMVDTIQRLVGTLAPDIFPPKTFEEMDDEERAASVANMIEERLRRGMTGAVAGGAGRTGSSMPEAGEQREAASQTERAAGVDEESRTDRQDAGAFAAQPEPEHGSGNVQMAEEASDDQATAGEEQNPDYGSLNYGDSFDARQTAELNDLIYKNLMEMMGMQNPQVEYPFDPAQLRYGREKSVTEMLEEERQEEERLKREQMEMERRNAEAGYHAAPRQEEQEEARPRSAWELAQDAINRQTGAGEDHASHSAWELAQDAVNQDEKAHEKEPYIPKVVDETPAGKSASQLAAEAIRRSQEEEKEKLEIEKQAERLMEEAKKRGQDPMKFALHQQEILRYMEKNSDELVSFEDYEDLSPEEKYEIERQLHIEKQLADGVHPDEVDEQVPEEFVPEELKARAVPASGETAQAETSGDRAAELSSDGTTAAHTTDKATVADAAAGADNSPVLTEEMLRQLSQEVIRENSDMILSENENEDMESLNDLIMQNILNMMSGSGAAVQQENVDDLLEQAAAAARGESAGAGSGSAGERTGDAGQEMSGTPAADAQTHQEEPEIHGLSAVELARAAQRAAKPEPKEVPEGKSAVELAKEVQEKAEKERKQKEAVSVAQPAVQEDSGTETGEEPHPAMPQGEMSSSGENTKTEIQKNTSADVEHTDAPAANAVNAETAVAQAAGVEHPENADAQTAASEASENTAAQASALETPENTTTENSDREGDGQNKAKTPEEPDEEFEYVDPDEMVLGEHTQAEIDEALDNLNSLGLEGEVYERAKRMLLLELAGSEAELSAWLKEQENGKKKKASVSALDHDDSMELDDLDDFDEDDLEKELELAMDEDFSAIEEERTGGNQSGEETTGEEEPDVEDQPEEESEKEEQQKEKSADAENLSEETDGQENENKSAGKTGRAEGEKDQPEEDIISEVEVEDTIPVPEAEEKQAAAGRSARAAASHKRVVRRREKKAGQEKAKEEQSRDAWEQKPVEEREYQVSLRHPFVLKNSASFMDQFENYIHDTQENRKLSTGFKRLDAMLRYGLHKGTYFIDSEPQYLKNSFMQQMADRAAESGVDVLYISTELSRYDLMVETISRLSYEIHQGDLDKAVSAMDIMTGENGASLESLKDELNWYRGRISEHLYILDQEAVSRYMDTEEEITAGDVLAELIRSIVREGAHKPVVFIDNIENILSMEDTADMKPLMEGIRRLAGELSIPILMSYGYAQAESETEMSAAEREFHETLGNLCDVYMELRYADMITEDSMELTEEDIQEMMEDGETLLINVLLHRNRRPLRASCQIQAVPKFNFYEE